MDQQFTILGGKKLIGEVVSGGSKNASFPILAATILLSKEIVVSNLPDIEDVRCFLDILKYLGVEVKYIDNNTVLINSTNINKLNIPFDLGSKIRGSYYFLGALISKTGKASIPHPGGCNIGIRPMDLHLKSLEKLGVVFSVNEREIIGRLENKKNGNIEIKLPFPSRGATINIILASCLADGMITKIINANDSPECKCLVDFLQKAGLNIYYENEDLIIVGKKEVELNKFSVIPDKIEVATILSAGIITGGRVTVNNVKIEDLKPFLQIIKQMGVKFSVNNNSVTIISSDNLQAINVVSGLKPPCIDADFEPILVALLCTAKGESYIEDKINPERHSNFLPQLAKMGANIEIKNNTNAIIKGGCKFKSYQCVSNDIRGGISLVLAALSANGKSEIKNVFQIDRGYEKIEEKLKVLGANINRENQRN